MNERKNEWMNELSTLNFGHGGSHNTEFYRWTVESMRITGLVCDIKPPFCRFIHLRISTSTHDDEEWYFHVKWCEPFKR